MIGHLWARQQLERAALGGRLGHAYLFTGPASVGKTALALYLAGLLVCGAESGRPCGTCRGCRAVARGQHPDVTVIEREAGRKEMGIEQVRQLEQSSALRPYEAPCKVFCLAGADALSAGGASALLKTLEEPPADVSLILTAEDAGVLPITIRSRCQMMSLQPVPAAAIAAALGAEYGVAPSRAGELAALARGRPGWAVEALTNPSLFDQQRQAQAAIAGLAGSGPYARLLAVDGWLGKGAFVEVRERALQFLAGVEAWWRDALLRAAGGEVLSRYAVGDASATGLPAWPIATFLTRVQEAASRVRLNVSPRWVLEDLMRAMPTVTQDAHAG
jgi:DNA polymerase-3 subunit delta'